MRRSSALPHVLFATYVAVCATALIWPVYAWAGSATEPRFLGLPPAFAWNVGWVAASFVVLLAYHLATGGERRS